MVTVITITTILLTFSIGVMVLLKATELPYWIVGATYILFALSMASMEFGKAGEVIVRIYNH